MFSLILEELDFALANMHALAILIFALLATAANCCTDAQSATMEEDADACRRANQQDIPWHLNGTPEELVGRIYLCF